MLWAQAKVRALTRKLEKKADRLGTPDQRLALYFLQALEARADGTASAKYTAPITIPAQVRKNTKKKKWCRAYSGAVPGFVALDRSLAC